MLSVSPQFLSVSSLPGGSNGRASVGRLVTLSSETTGFLTDGGKTSVLSMLVLASADPVDAWVSSDSFVSGVNHDNFEEFVGGILTNPVRVKNSKVGALSANTLLSNFSVSSGGLELSDTLVNGLSENATLLDRSLTSTSADSDSVDDVSLLSAVTDLSSLVVS